VGSGSASGVAKKVLITGSIGLRSSYRTSFGCRVGL